MDAAPTSDPRLDAAVRASLAWYDDVFRVHGIPTRVEGGLWRALGEPPRWHSAAKTLHPRVPAAEVVRAVEVFESCSVADSFATLDLAGHGFRQLFRATWLHAPARVGTPSPWPEGWSVVSSEPELAAWNTAHDTTGVLVPSLLRHPRFTLLARRSSDGMVAGAVLHDAGDVVELSNTWAVGPQADEVSAALACAQLLHPHRAVVGYTSDDTLPDFTGTGFEPVGPHVVWVREE
jgi:hypothetical protein